MFSDEVLEKIFMHPSTKNIPIIYQTIMINVIEKILEESKNDIPVYTGK